MNNFVVNCSASRFGVIEPDYMHDNNNTGVDVNDLSITSLHVNTNSTISMAMCDIYCNSITGVHKRNSEVHSHNILSIHDLWHNRLGYPNSKVVSYILRGLYPSYSYSNHKSFYIACQLGKLKQNHFPESTSRATKPFELKHIDL